MTLPRKRNEHSLANFNVEISSQLLLLLLLLQWKVSNYDGNTDAGCRANEVPFGLCFESRADIEDLVGQAASGDNGRLSMYTAVKR